LKTDELGDAQNERGKSFTKIRMAVHLEELEACGNFIHQWHWRRSNPEHLRPV
jgi:hypothetical protein